MLKIGFAVQVEAIMDIIGFYFGFVMDE